MVLARARRAFLLSASLILSTGTAPAQGPPSVPGPLSPIMAALESMSAESNVGRRDALESMLREFGVAWQIESFSIPRRETYPRTEGANLVVTLGQGERDLVIGAHYDAVWLPGGTLSRGAVDNAASAVVLARLAERLQGGSFRHRIRIVFFDMEEIGLIGSRQYVDAHGVEVAAAVNLDVNGYGDTIFYGPAAAPGNAPLYDAMREHCVVERLQCVEFPAYPSSDYRSFQVAGIPNLSLSVLPRIEAYELWLYENGGRAAFREGFAPRVLEMIHSPADTPERVEESAIELSLRSLEAFVRRLDAVLD